MSWVYLLLAVAAFAIAFKATTTAVVAIALVAAGVLLLAWLMGLLAARIERRGRDLSAVVDPAALVRLHEQAEARREAVTAAPPEA